MACLSIPTAGLACGGMSMIIITSFILIVMCVIMKRRQTSKWSKLLGTQLLPKYTMGGIAPQKIYGAGY